MSVREAQQRIDSREFSEWMAYYRVEPFGVERDDLRFAILLAMLSNVFRKKGKKAAGVEDFMIENLLDPERKTSGQATTVKEMKNLLRAVASVCGKVIKRGDDR